MAYILGCIAPAALVVLCVWQFGLVLGLIAALVIGGLVMSVLGHVMRTHYDPMSVYDDEQRERATRH